MSYIPPIGRVDISLGGIAGWYTSTKPPLVLDEGVPREMTLAERIDLGDGAFAPAASQAEMEAGTETALRSMSPVNVKQAIEALGGSGGASILTLAYEDRGDLRTDETSGLALVDGLGLFQYVAGSDEPDDDESCFATANGRWLLEAVHWDVVDNWQLPDDEVRDEADEDAETRLTSAETRLTSAETRLTSAETRLTSAETRWRGRILFGTAASSITSLAAVTQTSFTSTVTGALVGNHVVVTPPDALGARISAFARVTAANTVTIYLNNPSAAAQSLTAGTWRIAVIQES